MLSEMKPFLFSALGNVYKHTTGTGLAKIPGVKAVYYPLLHYLWPGDRVVEVQGSRMHVNPGELPERFAETFQPFVFQGVWEELTTQLFKEVVREGDTVVDLGANMGYFTLLAARLVGEKGRVYAFEPEPVNYDLLLRNIALNGYDNVVALQKAVSDTSDKVMLSIHSTDSGRHTIRQAGYGEEYGEVIEVESVTLDSFFKDKPFPDVVKIDVEGAELQALAGMVRIIEAKRDLKIFIEFYPALLEESGYTVEEFAHRLLNEWNFSILSIDEYYRNKGCMRIDNPTELVNLGKRREISNLLLEKR